MFTYVNQYAFPLTALRNHILKLTRKALCLEKRLVTVCLDEECGLLCKKNRIANCTQLDAPPTPYSQYSATVDVAQKHSYAFMTWLKYEMLFAALQVATEVFYLDADVMLFDNPFIEVPYGRNSTGAKIPGEYDIMYQRERGLKELGCGGSVNGGLLYLRNSSAIHDKFIPSMLKMRNTILSGSGRSDQDIVGDYVGRLSHCSLPVSRYMGACTSSKPGDQRVDVRKIITYHANCVGGMDNKLKRLKEGAERITGKIIK